jgi:hypothetical protein
MLSSASQESFAIPHLGAASRGPNFCPVAEQANGILIQLPLRGHSPAFGTRYETGMRWFSEKVMNMFKNVLPIP